MQGRQLFSYYALLFVFLILVRALVIELNSQFDLAVFPKLASVVQQVLDTASEFDNVVNTIGSLLYAFLFSLPVALVYRITKEEDRFDPALGQTIVLLSMVVTAVIVVISGDLARAFGLAGVVAAVRFRNTLDDAKDAVYVFCAIAIGMACGAKAFTVALWTSILMTSALYFLWRYQFGRLPGQMVAARDLGRKGKKGHKDKKKKKKDKAVLAATETPPDSGPSDLGGRLLEFAVRTRPAGAKKANAALVVKSGGDAPSAARLEPLLSARDGDWRRFEGTGTDLPAGTLAFVGRLSKHADPEALVQSLRLDAGIEDLQYLSLKGETASLPRDAVFPEKPEGGPANRAAGREAES